MKKKALKTDLYKKCLTKKAIDLTKNVNLTKKA